MTIVYYLLVFLGFLQSFSGNGGTQQLVDTVGLSGSFGWRQNFAHFACSAVKFIDARIDPAQVEDALWRQQQRQ